MLLQVTQRLILHLKLLAIVTSAKDYPMLHNFQGREMKRIKKILGVYFVWAANSVSKENKNDYAFFSEVEI